MEALIMKLIELFGLAFIIAFIASQGGVSGAYLLVPSQIYILGLLSPVISSTNFMYNLLATPLAIYRYAKEGRLIAPLVIVLAIGGASIVALILIANLNLPAYVTAGSTLVETLTTSATALVTYSTLGVLPNITVGLSIGIGGLIGSYIGASVQKIMPESRIKLMLGIITALIGVIDLLLHYFI
ncbi:MAG: TSUP family transporter [Vulcanisaeta sp.]